jgi:hypothetical protein
LLLLLLLLLLLFLCFVFVAVVVVAASGHVPPMQSIRRHSFLPASGSYMFCCT